ncbi:MAG: response regulator [Lachnospiraceae bacterium]|nr:response regulator [Lachnospiraceae bacterium]
MKKKKRILIIDDDVTYLKTINEWIGEVYSLSMASSGEQAFRWLEENTPDLILLDYEMPVMPGPQVMERLKDDEDLKYVPVVILTGKNDRESIMRIISMCPTGYLLKSLGKEELLEKLSGIIGS